MSYFFLPQIHKIIDINNIIVLTNTESKIILSKSLCFFLNSMKKQIDNYPISWDNYKKYTNPYEYIHTIIPYTKISICKLKPLSRSFYKLIEIHNLLQLFEKQDPIKTFHLAEGPGGFIEAIQLLRSNNNDIYYGMTLIDNNDDNIPGWKKSKYFLSKHNNIFIETGQDKTGNLCNVDNLWFVYKKYKGTIDLITGDGGFDFSIDFNKQEVLSTKLIFCQMCFAFAVQKKGGTFILKIFDIFTQATVDLLYILSLLYEQLIIIKPNTSRWANSEKYVVCKKFKLEETYQLIENLSNLFPLVNSDSIIERFLNIDIPSLYINKLQDINAIIGQQQLENILSTLYLLDNNKQEKLETIKKNNIQKCIQWCIKYKLPYNKNIQQLNVFLSNK
uniref:Ribosomal RNA methyltransferase FtsJ domain-containing protein n=1 Tax=viral metagenome TaxID=1070528 RepID=A0A6C0AZ75_9ZZZZ|tara:strand:- start:2190 stop:3356 length:1167 start_codon:yes stop_codon:yes gene_type:complete